MKYLGLDYGSKRIGLAISDPMGMIAFPRDTLANDEKAAEVIMSIVQNERIDVVVMGDTLSHGGKENPVTPEAKRFGESLAAKGVHVETIWEAWSSIEASRYAPEGKGHDDSSAAAILLQRYLDTKAAPLA